MKSVETIIVDDASSDSTSKVIEKWKGSPKPIYLFHKFQTGPAGARNTGMKKALNPYILFLDSDVLLGKKTYPIIKARELNGIKIQEAFDVVSKDVKKGKNFFKTAR